MLILKAKFTGSGQKLTIMEQGRWMWCEFIWLMLGKVTGFCEYSNEPLRPIKGREFIQ